MATKVITETINNGVYSCGDIGISASEWYSLLLENDAQQYIDALLCFLREPEHTSSCTEISMKNGNSPQYYNSKVTDFSKWIQNKLNRFSIKGIDGKSTYWSIAMQKGWKSKGTFQWQMRDELAKALQTFLMQHLIQDFKEREPFNGHEEEYKWALLDAAEGKDVGGIIRCLRSKNVVYNEQVDGILKKLLETKPEELTTCINNLLDENKALTSRIENFRDEMRKICPSEWKYCANDERTASAILACKYPVKYTFYKSEVYQTICKYFGFEYRAPYSKFAHFIEIINGFAADFGDEIQQIMIPQISKYKNKPLNLAVQTLFWCMKEEMKATKQSESTTNLNPNLQDIMPTKKYQKYIDLLFETRNLVLTGAPGTGKTYMAKEIAEEMEAEVGFVQFHPSYDYTDFVEGLRPVKTNDGQIGFERKDGAFKEFCKKAKSNNKPFVFIIDEINRGDISKVFGELFFSIDPGYRGERGKVNTQYQNMIEKGDVFKNGFFVPDNVYILATMNDIDRSVESMDFAMRRRFTWLEVTPADTAYMLDKLGYAEEAKTTMTRLNDAIAETEGLGAAYMIGPAYFLKLAENGGDFSKLWKMNIEPLLKEYLRGFRKSDVILRKFNEAYFDIKEKATKESDLINED